MYTYWVPSVALHGGFRRGLGQALLVVLFCSVGCKDSTPPRPVNVAASAVWVANAFIECAVEPDTNANRCSVRDAKGALLGDGLFILNNDGRAATNSELKYVAFREGRIYLAGERFLYPTLPQEQNRAAVDSELRALAGHGMATAIDCGRIAHSQNATPASECALNALTTMKPFRVRFDLQGYEGIYSFGLAGDGSENVYAVEDYSLLQDMLAPAGSRIGVTLCPTPIKIRTSARGILTCLSTEP